MFYSCFFRSSLLLNNKKSLVKWSLSLSSWSFSTPHQIMEVLFVLVLLVSITSSIQDLCIPSALHWQKKNLYFVDTTILDSQDLLLPTLPECVDYCGSISYNQVVHFNEMTTQCTCLNIEARHVEFSRVLSHNSDIKTEVVMQTLDESKYTGDMFHLS